MAAHISVWDGQSALRSLRSKEPYGPYGAPYGQALIFAISPYGCDPAASSLMIPIFFGQLFPAMSESRMEVCSAPCQINPSQSHDNAIQHMLSRNTNLIQNKVTRTWMDGWSIDSFQTQILDLLCHLYTSEIIRKLMPSLLVEFMKGKVIVP